MDELNISATDMTKEEFQKAITRILEQTKKMPARNPMTQEQKKARQNAILKAMNSPQNWCNKL